MAIAFRAIATGQMGGSGSGSTTLTVNKPTGTVDGDVMVAFVVRATGADQAANSITAPAGWASLGRVNLAEGASPEGCAEAFWKVAASEGASYNFTVSNAASSLITYAALGAIASYSGVVVSPSPISADAEQANTIGAANVTAPSVTAVGNEDMLICCFGTKDSASEADAITSSPPSGMTERADFDREQQTLGLGVLVHLGLYDQLLSAPGATGTRTATLSGRSSESATSGHAILLRSPATGGYHMML